MFVPHVLDFDLRCFPSSTNRPVLFLASDRCVLVYVMTQDGVNFMSGGPRILYHLRVKTPQAFPPVEVLELIDLSAFVFASAR